MNLKKRIEAFHRLGAVLEDFLETEDAATAGSSQLLHEAVALAKRENGWFTAENVRFAIQGIRPWLNRDALTAWLADYAPQLDETFNPKRIGIIMAGNIPLVGFHDFLVTLISGHTAVAKLSSQDSVLIRCLAKLLVDLEPAFADRIEFVDGKLEEPDAVIATGSNNSARYFQHYFGKYPNVIRQNRGSVAVLDGTESREELVGLGEDVFRYYGLGCRNVSKVFVPEGYDFNAFFEASLEFTGLLDNHKYVNNYHYNKTVYLLNKESLLDNELVVLKEDANVHSPVGVLFYEHYSDRGNVIEELEKKKDEIQCIVSREQVGFGQSQTPELSDYADGVNTVKFLTKIR